MKTIAILSLALMAGSLGACGQEEAGDAAAPQDPPMAAQDGIQAGAPSGVGTDAAAPATATHAHADWAGRWVGQEGLYADITPTEPGQYRMQMQLDLDTDATYVGRDADGGIAFEWNGETRLLREGTAEEINLKWVDGDDCLIVEESVGFCREA